MRRLILMIHRLCIITR